VCGCALDWMVYEEEEEKRNCAYGKREIRCCRPKRMEKIVRKNSSVKSLGVLHERDGEGEICKLGANEHVSLKFG